MWAGVPVSMLEENNLGNGIGDASTSDDQDSPSSSNKEGKTTLDIYECTLNSFRKLSPYPIDVIEGDSLARMMVVVLERAGEEWETTLEDSLADLLDLLLHTARDPFLDHEHYANIIKYIPELMRILMSGSTPLARQTCWELFDYVLASFEHERLVAKAATDAVMVVMHELQLEESYITRLYRAAVWLCKKAKRPDQLTDCYTLMRKLAAISERKKVDCILIPLFCDMFWDLREPNLLKTWAVALPKFAETIGPLATQKYLLELYLGLGKETDMAVLGAGIDAAPLMTYMLSCAYEQATTPQEQETALQDIHLIVEWIKEFFEDPLGSWKSLSVRAYKVIVPIMVTLRIPRIIKLDTSHADNIFIDCPLNLCKNSKCGSSVSGDDDKAKSVGDASVSQSSEVNSSNSSNPELTVDELIWLKTQVFEANSNPNEYEVELDVYQEELGMKEKYVCDDGSKGPLSLEKFNWALFKIYWQTIGDIIDTNIRIVLAHHITYLVRVFQGKYSLKFWLQIRNKFKAMATHSHYKVREAIASHLHELVLLLSDDIVEVDIIGVYYHMVNDEWEVKIAAYGKIYEIITQVSKEVLEFYLRWMAKISSNTVGLSQWRHRALLAHDFARCLPHYDIQLATKFMYQPIMRLLTDKIAAVRTEAINAISLMLVLAWQTPEISLKSFVCDIITQFGLSDQWLRRQTFAKIVESLLEWSSVERLGEGSRASLAAMLWETTAACANDTVPNVRLVCARTLVLLTLEPDHLLYNSLAALRNDADRDVRYFATDINWRRRDSVENSRKEQQ